MLPNLTVKCTLTCHILIGIIYGRILHEYKNPGSKKYLLNILEQIQCVLHLRL